MRRGPNVRRVQGVAALQTFLNSSTLDLERTNPWLSLADIRNISDIISGCLSLTLHYFDSYIKKQILGCSSF